MSKIRHIGMLVAGIAVFGTAAAGEWNVVTDSSAVKFSFIQQGSRANGKFGEFEAMIDFNPANPESGSIVGVVRLESVDTREYDRDATLQDPDFFDAAKYPEARFESTSIEKAGDEYVAQGELTLKGKTNPAAMRFTWEETAAGAQFLGKFTINRFDYNVGEGWNDTSFVGQDVDVEVDLTLAK